jgi:micrococcal nuclease
MYTYNATVDRVVDGDTVDALVDLGFDTWKKVRIRLYGLDAWESRTRDLDEKKKGLAAKQYLIDNWNQMITNLFCYLMV